MNRQFTLCVQWPRFGPYHLARLDALDRVCRERNIRLIALETVVSDELYDWEIESKGTTFERVQVFRNRAFEQIAPRQMHDGVQDALRKIDPDIVAISSYGYPDSRACLDWCARHKRGSVLMSETKSDDAQRIAWREYIKSKLVRTYDAALVGGTPHQEYLMSLGFPEDAIFLGCDAVDNEFFARGARLARQNRHSARSLPGLGDSAPFFLASNRFIARKNLSGLLDAYSMYREKSSDPWRLVLLGDGPLRTALEAQVADRSIPGVTFAGFQQIDDLPAYYGLAGCFVHPATVDMWGLVVNEAMAAGLPVIVSTGSGCHVDLVREGENGYTFDASDTRALTDCMTRIAGDDDFRVEAAKISREIISKWSTDRFARSMMRASDMAIQRRGRGMHPLVRLMIFVLRRARSLTAFHTVES